MENDLNFGHHESHLIAPICCQPTGCLLTLSSHVNFGSSLSLKSLERYLIVILSLLPAWEFGSRGITRTEMLSSQHLYHHTSRVFRLLQLTLTVPLPTGSFWVDSVANGCSSWEPVGVQGWWELKALQVVPPVTSVHPCSRQRHSLSWFCRHPPEWKRLQTPPTQEFVASLAERSSN